MQLMSKLMALAVLLAPLALTAPTENTPENTQNTRQNTLENTLENTLLANPVLAAPIANTLPADPPMATTPTRAPRRDPCTSPGAYRCKCDLKAKPCWLDVCNDQREWQHSARCRDRKDGNSEPTCRNGPISGTAYCI